MTTPVVDVIVPVHDRRRPVARLAASILDHTATPLRITFVCHALPTEAITGALGAVASDRRIRLLACDDDTAGPAAPFRAGLAESTAPFVMKVDSDDSLEPGAIDAWLRLARQANADIVVCRMRSVETGREWATPPARPGRRRNLDPLRDRLAYRTSTMGLVARGLMASAPPTLGLPTGEDIESSLRLWYSGASVALATHEPAYLVHDDAADRATALRAIKDEFAWLDRLLESHFVESLSGPARAAIATKLIRVQLFGAVAARAHALEGTDQLVLRRAARQLADLAGELPRWLSRSDHDLLSALADPQSSPTAIARLSAERRRFGHPATLLPRDLRYSLHREAPLRVMAASAIAARRRARPRS